MPALVTQTTTRNNSSMAFLSTPCLANHIHSVHLLLLQSLLQHANKPHQTATSLLSGPVAWLSTQIHRTMAMPSVHAPARCSSTSDSGHSGQQACRASPCQVADSPVPAIVLEMGMILLPLQAAAASRRASCLSITTCAPHASARFLKAMPKVVRS